MADESNVGAAATGGTDTDDPVGMEADVVGGADASSEAAGFPIQWITQSFSSLNSVTTSLVSSLPIKRPRKINLREEIGILVAAAACARSCEAVAFRGTVMGTRGDEGAAVSVKLKVRVSSPVEVEAAVSLMVAGVLKRVGFLQRRRSWTKKEWDDAGTRADVEYNRKNG